MPDLTAEVPVVKSVIPPPPPMQPNPTTKASLPSARGQLAFNYFTQEMHQSVSVKYPNLKTLEVSQLLGKMWSKMAEVEMSKYCEMAENERNRLVEIKGGDEEKTENLLFREGDMLNVPGEKEPLEGPGLSEQNVQSVAFESEPTLEETSGITSNGNIAEEYQITIKKEPISEPANEEPISEVNDQANVSAFPCIANEEYNTTSEAPRQAALQTPVEIKTERIEINSVESMAPQEEKDPLADKVPSENHEPSVVASNDTSTKEGTEEPCTDKKVPNTQVIFHNLDFFIKTEPNEIQSEEKDKSEVNASVDADETNQENGDSQNTEPMKTLESKETKDAPKNEESENERAFASPTVTNESSANFPL